MKKILLLLTLITFSAFAQNPDYHRYGVRTPFTKYISYTTSQRDALTPTSTDRTIIHHKDTGINRLEQWDGDSWEELGSYGAVESVQGYTGAVVLDADDLDDFSTLNKFVTEEEKDLIAGALQDAPSDGNEYVRKDGDWEVATGGGDNIYNADGTLPENATRTIDLNGGTLNIGGTIPNLTVNDTMVTAYILDGMKFRGFSTSGEDGDGKFTGIINGDLTDPENKAYLAVYNTDSTLIKLSAQKLKFDIVGTTPATGDVLTLQPDGTTKFQAPSGGGGGADDQTASEVPFTPYSTIAATNVQDAIEEVLDEIPTSLAAANITVSPAIGGNTDAYAVMDDHEDRIDDLETQIAILTPTFTTTAPSQVISLTKIGGTFYATPEYQNTYTLTESVDGAFAELAIDTTGETVFPTVTGATLWQGATFEAATDFSLVVRDIDGTRVYFFLKR